MPDTRSRHEATFVAIAPLALSVAHLWHPFLPGRLPNQAAVGAAVAAGPTRWALAHLAAGIASGLVILAFIAIRNYLKEVGEGQWAVRGLPFLVLGAIIYTLLPGMEFAPLAAVEAGVDPVAIQEGLQGWFVPFLMAGSITFAIGILAFSKAIVDSRILSPSTTWLVVAALIIMAASRATPFAVAQFYVQSVAALIALLPLAYRMWSQTSVARPAAR